MGGRDREKERHQELAAVWGSDVTRGIDGTERRMPRRKGVNRKMKKFGVKADNEELDDEALERQMLENEENGVEITAGGAMNEDNGFDEDTASTVGSEDGEEAKKKRLKRKEERTARRVQAGKLTKSELRKTQEFKLHCFIGQGINNNDIREVFEHYTPKVEIKTTQRGNVLNKTQYAILTFRNKALGLHAVKMLDGTDQRDSIGMKEFKLQMMLSREQNKIARRRLQKSAQATLMAKKAAEDEADRLFLANFLKDHKKKKN